MSFIPVSFTRPQVVPAWEIQLGDTILYDGKWYRVDAKSRSTGKIQRSLCLHVGKFGRKRKLAVRPDDLICRLEEKEATE